MIGYLSQSLNTFSPFLKIHHIIHFVTHQLLFQLSCKSARADYALLKNTLQPLHTLHFALQSPEETPPQVVEKFSITVFVFVNRCFC